MDCIGEVTNGALQCFIGYSIMNQNIAVLAGRSIGPLELKRIRKVILKQKGIISADEIKTSPISANEFRLVANLTFDKNVIRENVLQKINKNIKGICKDKDLKELENIACKSVDIVISQTAEVVVEIEEIIKKEFPQASHIQIVGQYK